MEGLTLLQEAKAAGLTVIADGDKLIVRGPRRLEHVARKLLDHKPDVLPIVKALNLAKLVIPGSWTVMSVDDQAETPIDDAIDPPDPCPNCGGIAMWWPVSTLENPEPAPRCDACDPPDAAMKLLNRTEQIRRRCPRAEGYGPNWWAATTDEPASCKLHDEPNGVRCHKCSSTEYVDVPIHGGRSTRRDCRRCGAFIDFTRWYEPTLAKYRKPGRLLRSPKHFQL